MAQAKELHNLLDRVSPGDTQLVRSFLTRLAYPLDDEPVTQEDIDDVEYSLAHPEDSVSHEEILREFGLADTAPLVK